MERNQISKETVELFDKIVRESDRFFLITTTSSNSNSNNNNNSSTDRDENFHEFHNIQKTVYDLSKLTSSSIMKRPRDSLQSLTSSSGKKQK